MKKLVLLAALAALAVPSFAHAGSVAMRVQDVPLGPRGLASAATAQHFNMLAVHWAGSGAVLYRVHALHGAWRPWRSSDDDVAPDGGNGAWRKGNIYWTGAADGVQFRTQGSVTRLRSYELWSRVTAAPRRALAQAGTPAIVTRAQWGADEEIVRARPLVAPTLRLAVVHHTAGTNTYTRAQAAAIVRGIEVYHVRGNGWNDIGYNFLVDRFGTVYEGRAGGIEKNVIGAHAEGFNTGTAGVALIGNYAAATPPAAQQNALVQVLAWRLDVAHIDPLSTVLYTSGGNYKFRAGKPVLLRAISGHRDTGPSECPGTRAYSLLPAIAKRVAVTGLPKLYAPSAVGSLGGPVRFQARLSSSLAWTVVVLDQLGKTVAQGSGTGRLVDWTWHSPVGSAGRYSWTIGAPGIRVATGSLGVTASLPPPTPLSLTSLAATPGVLGPALDGTGAETTISFNLGAAARVTGVLVDASGATVAPVFDEQREAGANIFLWQPVAPADGRYRLTVTAKAGTKSVTKAVDLVIDRTLTGFTESLPAISPNGDGVNDTVRFSYMLTQNAPLRLEITQNGTVVATPFQGQPGIGAHTLDWDGTANGVRIPDGQYLAALTFTDALGDVRVTLPFAVDTTPPVLTLVDPKTLTFTLSEPATVTVLVNQKTRLLKDAPKGTFTVGYTGSAVTQVSAEAQDPAGNISAIVSG